MYLQNALYEKKTMIFSPEFSNIECTAHQLNKDTPPAVLHYGLYARAKHHGISTQFE